VRGHPRHPTWNLQRCATLEAKSFCKSIVKTFSRLTGKYSAVCSCRCIKQEALLFRSSHHLSISRAGMRGAINGDLAKPDLCGFSRGAIRWSWRFSFREDFTFTLQILYIASPAPPIVLLRKASRTAGKPHRHIRWSWRVYCMVGRYGLMVNRNVLVPSRLYAGH
jgi:hypothetical protein